MLYEVITIADQNGELYDSAIFLEAGSFSSQIDLGSDRLLSDGNAVCFGQDYVIDTQLPSTYTYKWYKDNVLLVGEINPSYTVKDSGLYRVEVTLATSTCTAINRITSYNVCYTKLLRFRYLTKGGRRSQTGFS